MDPEAQRLVIEQLVVIGLVVGLTPPHVLKTLN